MFALGKFIPEEGAARPPFVPPNTLPTDLLRRLADDEHTRLAGLSNVDFVRASVVAPSSKQLIATFNHLMLLRLSRGAPLEVIWVKNTFGDAEADYQDIKLIVRFQMSRRDPSKLFVGEIQLQLEHQNKIKQSQHLLYEVLRNDFGS